MNFAAHGNPLERLPALALSLPGLKPRASRAWPVREEEGRIVLSPVLPEAADRVREKLAELGIQPSDIAKAVGWARRQ